MNRADVTPFPRQSTEAILTYVDTLLRRNAEFASHGFNPNLRMMPSGKSLIVGCVDPRVDPMDIFKLEPGEAAIFRNVGGRVTPALIETMGLLRSLTHAAGKTTRPASNLIVLHHTDCGINHCYHHAPELLAQHMGVPQEELDAQAITDPYKSVVLDVTALRANPNIRHTVSGLVYDVATGRVETVVPPAPLHR